MTNKIDERIAALEAELAFANKTALDMMEQRDELAALIRDAMDTYDVARWLRKAQAALTKLERDADGSDTDT